MSWILRRIVAAPRRQHSDNYGTLDLAYITPKLIVTSMPAGDYLHSWYRNSVKDLRSFLVRNHQDNWKLYNLRAEADGDYKDDEFSGKVVRYPFPDHGPPPFDLIPEIVISIDSYLNSSNKNVAVIHCKAGQGRSGTIACAYLMYARNLTKEDAIEKFTMARMLPKYGLQGVSIASQKRYLGYMEKWLHEYRTTGNFPVTIERCYRIEYIQLINPNEKIDVKIQIQEFIDNGRSTNIVYTIGNENTTTTTTTDTTTDTTTPNTTTPNTTTPNTTNTPILEFRPSEQHLLLSDIGIKVVTTNRMKQTGTQIWFNCFFENSTEQIFTASWDEFDGFLGTKLRGIKTFDEIKVKWS